MARVPRGRSESGIYHAMLRGINRQTIFEDDGDKEVFIETVNTFQGDSNYKAYAYCLMDNHVHLLIQELDDSISTVIKRIAARYVYWFNKKHGRCGHLFQGRFKSEAVEDDRYFLTVLRYVHQNPLRAGLASDMDSCRWTSYEEYLVKERRPVVDINTGLDLFSPHREKAVRMYIEFHHEAHNDKCMDFADFVRLNDEEVRAKMLKLGYTVTTLQHRVGQGDRLLFVPLTIKAGWLLCGLPGFLYEQNPQPSHSPATGLDKSAIFAPTHQLDSALFHDTLAVKGDAGMREAMAADVRENFARYDFGNYTHVIEKVGSAWLKEFDIVTRFDDGDVLVYAARSRFTMTLPIPVKADTRSGVSGRW